MLKIIKVEIQQYFKEPLIYGFFLLPILLMFVFTLVLSKPEALASIIFIQMLLVSLFVYGNKVMVYRNDTLRKKVNNSKLSKIKITGALLIINVVFIISSLMIPIIWTMLDVHSLSWASENQWWYFVEGTTINKSLEKGLTQTMLLFNSTFTTWLQFLFAFTTNMALTLGFAHLVACTSKDDIRYFSLSIIISIVVILISNIFKKDMYVMTDGAYVMDSMTIKNGFWNVLKNINPFYWSNQLLKNTIIADQFSGTYVLGDISSGVFTSSGTPIIMEGLWTPSYYNVFHLGTNANPTVNTSRPVCIDGIELSQILTIASPMIFSFSFASLSLMIEEVGK